MTAPSVDYFAPTDPAAVAPEAEIVRDLLRRGLMVAPVFLVVGLLLDGLGGAASAAVGVILVTLNFLAAAASLTWAARINLGLLMGVSLFGYLIRLGLMFAAVFFIRDLAWVHLTTLGLTIVIMHLGLLIWELKYVSASLANPGLKPVNKEHNR